MTLDAGRNYYWGSGNSGGAGHDVLNQQTWRIGADALCMGVRRHYSMAKQILVVDDEPDVLQIIQTILMSKGYDVHGCTDGATGLEEARRIAPDLIVCDLMMPGMSGLEFIRNVRKDQQIRRTPIIALSALGQNSDKSEDFWKRGLNADDFLSKPFDPLDLLGRVEYLFRRRDYVSTQDESLGIGGEEGRNGEKAPAVNLAEASPRQIVRLFVESWNQQDFQTEFRCLAEEMTGGLNEAQYMARRRQCYFDEQGAQRQQRIVNYLEDSTSHNASKVVCEREDEISGRKKARKETYVLRKGADGWRIVSMRSVPIIGAPANNSTP